MTRPRIVFMGTPNFALPALEKLHRLNFPIVSVVTQPDRPQGRGQRQIWSPVKMAAHKLGLPVFQPEKVKDPSFLDAFHALSPDMVVVAAFGQILPKSIIEFPPMGCLNIHPSLLPKYRGAAPINWTIIRGETVTGVTIIYMDEGMDSGDILLQEKVDIHPLESYGSLHDRLANIGANLLLDAIEKTVSGAAVRRPQDASQATYAPRLKKETCLINWSANSIDIGNLIRGLSPEPAAYTFLDGQVLKIFAAEACQVHTSDAPGTISKIDSSGLLVAAAKGTVSIKEVQLAGRKRMPINAFLRGCRLNPGTALG